MPFSENVEKVRMVAQKAIKTDGGIKEFVDKYSLEELEEAFIQLSADQGSRYHNLIKLAIEKKKSAKNTENNAMRCGPLAKILCDQMDDIKRSVSSKNVFLDIPYSNYEDCEKVLRDLLKEMGLNAVAAKDRLTSNAVLCKVCKLIQSCKYGISDISSASNSVVYEYGLMHGIGIPVCLALREESEKFTDIHGLEHLPYKDVRSFKIIIAKWAKDNIEGVDRKIIDKIITEEEKELKEKGGIPLKKILPQTNKLSIEIKSVMPLFNPTGNRGGMIILSATPDSYCVEANYINHDINRNTVSKVELVIDDKKYSPLNFKPIKIEGRTQESHTIYFPELRENIKSNGKYNFKAFDILDNCYENEGDYPVE